jgi:hypothetical protein
MSSIVLSGDTSGTVTVAVPAVAGTNTVTIAAQTGTLNAAGPAFSVYRSGNQSIANNTFVKVQFNAEEFDTNNNFDSTTNYRFTPTVAGYYQINAAVSLGGTTFTLGLCSIFKNGSEYKRGNQIPVVNATPVHVVVSSIIYFNGSTDYVEIYGYSVATSGNIVTGTAAESYFNGCLVRGT